MSDTAKYSFTAASSLPLKLLFNRELFDSVAEKKFIPPWHIQCNPTSQCNQNCDWCSCSNRDKNNVLGVKEILEVFRVAQKLGGGKATTLTGDGDPLLHPYINEIILGLNKLNVHVGLVTNGWGLTKLSSKALSCLSWMRVSLGDGQLSKTVEWWDALGRTSELMDGHVGFSYVLTAKPDYKLIVDMIRFANKHKLTHVRIVNNILEAKNLVKVMSVAQQYIRRFVDDDRVIWQSRSNWTLGTNPCYHSLLRPVLGSDGLWYSCCGNQYMLSEATQCYTMPMSSKRCAEGLQEIITSQRFFDGIVCKKCFYENYNVFLKLMLTGLKDERFV